MSVRITIVQVPIRLTQLLTALLAIITVCAADAATYLVNPDASEIFRFRGITFREIQGFEARFNKQIELDSCRFEFSYSLIMIWPYVMSSGQIRATDYTFIGCMGYLSARTVELTDCDVFGHVGGVASGRILDATNCDFRGNPVSEYGAILEPWHDEVHSSQQYCTDCVFMNDDDCGVQVGAVGLGCEDPTAVNLTPAASLNLSAHSTHSIPASVSGSAWPQRVRWIGGYSTSPDG